METFFFFWLLSTVPNYIQSDVLSHSNYLLSYASFYCWLFVPFSARHLSYLFKNMSLIFSYVRPQTLMGAGLYLMEDILLSAVKRKWEQLQRKDCNSN
ncbi:hypothetical protein CISIN_1g041041mg [Citrus sinensis]|uniref:HVA22-like protein n=1 Tax=Citrus sinensis TaxID=2711 RepID=A0A067DFD3_CITSI|nr:hypothetical protein CISIN_1g041041mg [Citrus sinensis]